MQWSPTLPCSWVRTVTYCRQHLTLLFLPAAVLTFYLAVTANDIGGSHGQCVAHKPWVKDHSCANAVFPAIMPTNHHPITREELSDLQGISQARAGLWSQKSCPALHQTIKWSGMEATSTILLKQGHCIGVRDQKESKQKTA